MSEPESGGRDRRAASGVGRVHGPSRAANMAIVAAACAVVALLGYLSLSHVARIDQTMRVLGVVPLSPEEVKARDAKAKADAAAVIARLRKITDYQTAKWHPLHFKPEIDTATNEQCLVCHQEVLKTKVRPSSPAGVQTASAVAWYQTLDTYTGDQETFHTRHLTTPFATQVMSLSCNFCHQGHDPREEAPRASATAAPPSFALRKVVDPSTTCLLCHGAFPGESMGFDKTQGWDKIRVDMESADTPNGCLMCHAEQFRTVRHQVSYLKADAIEAAAKAGSSDTCFGCHGGRSWYRISFPYPRHPWPGMDKAVPDWAKGRPPHSDPRYELKK